MLSPPPKPYKGPVVGRLARKDYEGRFAGRSGATVSTFTDADDEAVFSFLCEAEERMRDNPGYMAELQYDVAKRSLRAVFLPYDGKPKGLPHIPVGEITPDMPLSADRIYRIKTAILQEADVLTEGA